MVRIPQVKTKDSHIFIFGTLIIFIFSFVSAKYALSAQFMPTNAALHTNLVYYDGQFSEKIILADLNTALYVLNKSNEYVYATVFEYDPNHREISTSIQIAPMQNQFVKPDGPGVVYLMNPSGSASSTVKFSRWFTSKKYSIPAGFTF